MAAQCTAARTAGELADRLRTDRFGGLHRGYAPTDLACATSGISKRFQLGSRARGASAASRVHAARRSGLRRPRSAEKIVLNLLSSFKFMLLEIAVSVRRVDGMAELTVADTGVGIPEEELPRLFERFRRVRDSGGAARRRRWIGCACPGARRPARRRRRGRERARDWHHGARAHPVRPGPPAAASDRRRRPRRDPGRPRGSPRAIEDAERWHPGGARPSAPTMCRPTMRRYVLLSTTTPICATISVAARPRWRVTTAVDVPRRSRR